MKALKVCAMIVFGLIVLKIFFKVLGIAFAIINFAIFAAAIIGIIYVASKLFGK